MRLSENGYFSQSLCQAQIIILEILHCIPVVIIFAFLDLVKNISFSDSLLGGRPTVPMPLILNPNRVDDARTSHIANA